MQKNTFIKAERLCSTKIIEQLFKKGSGFNEGIIRIIHHPVVAENYSINQVLISVSKKKINKASHRNPIRRKIKEAYRLNKHILEHNLKVNHSKFCFAIIYRSSEQKDYKEIEDKIILSFQRLAKIYGKDLENVSTVVD